MNTKTVPKKVVDSPTVPVTIRLGPDVVEMLRDLVGGIYGDSRAEVGKSLIRDQLKLANVQDLIEKARAKRGA